MTKGTVVFETEHPACFELRAKPAERFAAWREMAVVQRVGRSSFCTDCTREYRDEATRVGLCEHPLTKFVLIDPDDGAFGVRPMSQRQPLVVKKKMYQSPALQAAA